MFISSDEARSDLILSAAVYVIGPLVVGFLFGVVSLPATVAIALEIPLSLAYTVLVPYLLIRYRRQSLSEFGFAGPKSTVLTGLLVAVPAVVAGVASGWLSSGELSGAAPVTTAVVLGSYLDAAARLIDLVALTLLAMYCTVLAREAFRGDPAYLASAARHVGKFVGIAAAIATLLLLANQATSQANVGALVTIGLLPIGVAGTVALAVRLSRPSRLTTRATLVTPMVLFALGSFRIFASPQQIVFGIWSGALVAGVGLTVALLLESERSVWGPLALAVVLGLLTHLPL